MNDLINSLSGYAVAFTAIVGALSLLIKPLRKWISKALGSRQEEILKKLDQLDTKIQKVSDKNDSNERDRLKDEIFRFGNIARRKQHISSEEFRNLGENFEKYTELGGNHLARAEFDFIFDYYNRRGWEEDS